MRYGRNVIFVVIIAMVLCPNAFAGILSGRIIKEDGKSLAKTIHSSGEKSRNHQLYAEIVSRREVSDTELRAKMFENLIKAFFGDGSGKQKVEQKLTLLCLLALNFHEFFNLEPLFDQLESELGTKEERARLHEIAREIVSKQEAMLSQVEEGRVFAERLLKGNRTESWFLLRKSRHIEDTAWALKSLRLENQTIMPSFKWKIYQKGERTLAQL